MIVHRCLYHSALLYNKLGWIVLPLCGKVPLRGCRLKDLFARQTQSRQEVEMMFPLYSKKNIGIITGPTSNLIVVDVDDPAQTPIAVEHFGETPFVVCTGKQGYHYYYRYPRNGGDIGCRTKLWGKKIDIRGFGGYVTAPYSRHPETKNQYEWLTPLEQLSLGDMPVFDASVLPPKKTPSVSIPPPASTIPHSKKNSHQASKTLSKQNNLYLRAGRP